MLLTWAKRSEQKFWAVRGYHIFGPDPCERFTIHHIINRNHGLLLQFGAMERTRKSNQQKLNREIFIKENWTTVFKEMETYQLSVWVEPVIIHHKRNGNHGLPLQLGAMEGSQESNQQKLNRELFIKENWTIVFKEMETCQLSVWIYFSATSLTIWLAISYVSHLANLQVNRKPDNFLAMPIFIPGSLETLNHIISQ